MSIAPAPRLKHTQEEETARYEVMRLLRTAPEGCSRRVLGMKNAETSWTDVLTLALEGETACVRARTRETALRA